MSGVLKKDDNGYPVMGGVSSSDANVIINSRIDPITGRLLVDNSGGGGSGTVTSVSVVTANGVSGSVANPTTTPAITLTLGDITPSSVTVSGLTASQIVATDGSKTLQSLTTATYPSLTELSYVKGVTSAIQTQLNAKGAGTVTTVSVATANGFAGTVANATTTPAITLTTSINSPVLAGNGTAISAATTTGSTSTVVLQTSPTLITPVLGVATATSINKVTITAPATSATLTLIDGTTLTGPASSGTAATLGNAETFTGAKTFTKTIQTRTAMGAQALDGSLGNMFTRTLAGSETFTQSNFSTGQNFIVEVKQGSGTSYTVTWFSGVTWITSGATAPVQTTTTNGFTTYGFTCYGSNTFYGYLVGTQ